jgi:hypothetical protein
MHAGDELGGHEGRLEHERETEQSLLHRGPVIWAVANGGQLGLGFTSRIGFWSWYLMPIGIFLLADPLVGALAWGARLYYVPVRYWSSEATATTLGAEDLASGQQSVTVESCPQQPFGYTGGVTTPGLRVSP